MFGGTESLIWAISDEFFTTFEAFTRRLSVFGLGFGHGKPVGL
jgi:hypothetical protein